MEPDQQGFVVVARFTARRERISDLRTLLTETSHHAWTEEGLNKYVLTQDAAQPEHFVLVEFFRSEGDYQLHRTSEYMAAFRDRLAPLIALEPDVFRGRPVLSEQHDKARVT